MANFVSDIINQAYNHLGVISTTAEGLSATYISDAFRLLNQMWSSWSLEQTMVHPAKGTFALLAGTKTYLLGPGASWNSTPNTSASSIPLRVTGWSASSGNFRKGGRPLSFSDFYMKIRDDMGVTAQLIQELAADAGTGDPQILNSSLNIQVWPTPGAGAGNVDLEWMYTLPAFSSTGQSLNMAPGYERALAFNLAMELAPTYARQSGLPAQLEKNALDSKLAIMSMNAAILGVNQQQAPAA